MRHEKFLKQKITYKILFSQKKIKINNQLTELRKNKKARKKVSLFKIENYRKEITETGN